MEKSIKITAIVMFGIILSVLIISNSFGNSSFSGKTVNAEGIAQIKAMPDLVSVYFNVETKGKTSENATKQNSAIVERLKENLLAVGIEEEEIQTQSFSVYPNYNWVGNKRTEDGFIAVHALKVEISAEESEKIGEIIDAGISAGAGISYINFELSQEKQTEYKIEAMKLASQDAKVKARAIASGLDKKIGDIVSVNVNDFGYYPWNVYSGSGRMEDSVSAKAEVTSITPSEQEITARVNVVFKLR